MALSGVGREGELSRRRAEREQGQREKSWCRWWAWSRVRFGVAEHKMSYWDLKQKSLERSGGCFTEDPNATREFGVDSAGSLKLPRAFN